MTSIVKTKPSKIDLEGEQLWYGLFALRQLCARWHMRNVGRVIPQVDALSLHRKHKEIVQGFFVEMGQREPGSAR